jgi:membrane associated rhomboid family serine protease
MTPVTRSLLISNIVVFMLQSLGLEPLLVLHLALWPLGSSSIGAGFEPWQLVSYAFLHGGLTHIGLNMLALWMFGTDVERALGSRRFLRYYLVCVIAAGLSQLTVASLAGGDPYPTVGASGGVFGVLLAFAVFWPRRIIMLLFPPIPLPAWLFVSIYALIELVLGVTGTSAGVAHFAHLGGMVGGWLMLRHWQRPVD